MLFSATSIEGAWVIDPSRHADERGYFARTFCAREFAARGLDPAVVQSSVSFNHRRGTVRGMHWQAPPAEEAKLVRVVSGAVWDVIVSLESGERFGVELSAANGRALYIPPGCAHGFQTLADDTTVQYQMNEYFEPSLGRGARWDDPVMGVSWPLPVSVISSRDASWPLLEREPAAARAG